MTGPDAKRIADRYIGRDGGPPRKERRPDASPELVDVPASFRGEPFVIRDFRGPPRVAFDPEPLFPGARFAAPRSTPDAHVLAALAFFIGGHDPGAMHGGHHASTAMEALAAMSDIPVHMLCDIVGWPKPGSRR